MFLMPGHKDLILKTLRKFLADNRTNGRYLLEALGELFEFEPRGREEEPTGVELEELIRTAATRAALRDPTRPLDQRVARKAYLVLFRDLETARLGKLTVGRRGRPTRFRFAWGTGVEGGPRALRSVLRDLEIKPDSWVREQELEAVVGPPGPAAAPGPPPEGRLRRDAVVAQLQAKGDELHRLGVTNLSLFGSVARDEARPDSDVDLLVTFESSITSDGFFGAKFFLEDLLGRRVDLVTESALRDRVRQTIEPELIRVA